jgi:hypothetical protein
MSLIVRNYKDSVLEGLKGMYTKPHNLTTKNTKNGSQVKGKRDSPKVRLRNLTDFNKKNCNESEERESNKIKKRSKNITVRAASSELYKFRRLRSKYKKREEKIKKNITKNLRYCEKDSSQNDLSNVFKEKETDDKDGKFLKKFKKMVSQKEFEEKLKNKKKKNKNILRSSYTSKMKNKINKMKEKRMNKKTKRRKTGLKPYLKSKKNPKVKKEMKMDKHEMELINLYRNRIKEDFNKEIPWRVNSGNDKHKKSLLSWKLGKEVPKPLNFQHKKQKTKKENQFKMQFEDFKNNSNSEFLFNFLDEQKNLDKEEQILREIMLKKFLVQENAKIKKLKHEPETEKSRRNINRKENQELEESFTDLEWVFDKSTKKVSYKNFKNLLSKSPSRVNHNVYIRALDIIKSHFEQIEEEISETNEEMVCLDQESEDLMKNYSKLKQKQDELKNKEKNLDKEIISLTNELREKKSNMKKKNQPKKNDKKKKKKKIEGNKELIQKMRNSKFNRGMINNMKKSVDFKKKEDTDIKESKKESFEMLKKKVNEKVMKRKKNHIKNLEEEYDVADINNAFKDIKDLLIILVDLKKVYNNDKDFLAELRVYEKIIEGYKVELEDSEHDKKMTIYSQQLEIEKLKKKIELLEESIR